MHDSTAGKSLVCLLRTFSSSCRREPAAVFGIEDIKEAGRGGREQEEAESRKKKEYQCVHDRNPKQESESAGTQPVAQQGIQ